LTGIEKANTSEFVGISLVGIESFQDNDLIALDPGGFVDGLRVEASEPEVAFGSGDKEGRCLTDGIKATEIQISMIDNVKGAWFENQLIEDVDVVNLAMRNNDEGRDTSPQIQEGMQFHCAFVGSELGPWEKGQTQIDGGRVQSIGGLIQFDSEGIVGVEATSLTNENLCEVGIDSPISDLVGVSQGIARDLSSKAHVIEFPLSRTQTCLDVSETFPIGQLSKGHAKELIETRKAPSPMVALIPVNAFVEFVSGEKAHDLRKNDSP
jgi:hypothetical protein